MTASKTSSLVLAGILAVAALTGCSDEDKGSPDNPSGTAPVSQAPSASGNATGSLTGSAQPNETVTAGQQPEQPAGAIADVKNSKCTAKDGTWTLTATIDNQSKEDYTFTVRAAVVKQEGSTVLGDKELKETVPAGKTKKVEAKSFYKEKKDDGEVLCVVSATKAEAKG